MIHYCPCGRALGDGERVYNGGICAPCKRNRHLPAPRPLPLPLPVPAEVAR